MAKAMKQLCALLVVNLFAVSVFAQGSPPQLPTEDAELQKLDAMMSILRNRNAQDHAITAPNGIDKARYVQIGGIEQWITMRGEDRNNPVLLSHA